ncbi:MAG: hypothetical protein ACLT16_13605 [[Clostridium] innocuum]
MSSRVVDIDVSSMLPNYNAAGGYAAGLPGWVVMLSSASLVNRSEVHR